MRTWMRVQFFLFFFSWVTFLSYWGVIFDARGFDGSEIGLSITVSLVTRAVAVVTLFPLANRWWPIGTIARWLPWLCFVLGLAFLPHTGLTGLLLLSAAFGVLYPTLMPLLETTAALGAQRGALVYGPVRLWGSLGFVIGAAVNGVLARVLGNGALLPVFLLALLALSIMALRPIGDEVVAAQRSGSIGAWGPLFGHRVFMLALGICVLVQSSHAAYYAFGALHLEKLQVDPLLVALFLMLAPLSEMAVFRLTAGVADRWPLVVLMLIATLGALARWGIWVFEPPVAVLLASQLLHGLTFGIMQVGFIQTMRRHIEPHLMAPAQGLYSALGTGAGTAVMTAIAGHFFDISLALTFVAMLVCVLPALPGLIGLALAERRSGPVTG
ncbi:MFS transporter [Brachybacterium muris]|uniref:MFS transporter n=1 Tax=Brachybacterium muris TaxID=219301 RepID=UPI00223A9F3B|nr:MFS transporter [Brachybacterium muris]